MTTNSSHNMCKTLWKKMCLLEEWCTFVFKVTTRKLELGQNPISSIHFPHPIPNRVRKRKTYFLFGENFISIKIW